MAYRNKTYVIFDGDHDMWAYAYMKGWRSNTNMSFNFHDAHDLKPLTNRASDDTIYRRLRERFSSAKQVVVLIGDNTRYLHKFVRWELQVALDLDLPIIAANLNGSREIDYERCPRILVNEFAVHVSFNAVVIQYALDTFVDEYINSFNTRPRCYSGMVCSDLGL